MARELLERLGKLLVPRHLCAPHENGDNLDFALQRSEYFNADEIVCVAEPRPVLVILERQPILADECNQSVAGADLLLDHFYEVTAWTNVCDVHEDVVRAKARADLIVEPPGISTGVVAPVTDEDVGHDAAILSDIGKVTTRVVQPTAPGGIRYFLGAACFSLTA